MRINHHARRLGYLVTGAAIATMLASCGGNGDGGSNNRGDPVMTPPAPTNMPPASASTSSLGFIEYLKVLTATTQNTVEPLDLTNFVAPTDDTGAFDPTI